MSQPTSGPTAALELRDVRKRFGATEIIRGVNLTIGKGERHALIGPNGAGKSTLLKGIVGDVTTLSGEILLTDCDRRAIAYLPQLAEIDRSFPITVCDMVAMGLWRKRGAWGGV
ncbi:ATP-binding cassette domain-containing protein, partial [Mycobacterium tuberculosis]|nr:ATP-binding cassette domain-containing protein [Mycobacterium tuberculosis]